MTIQQQNTANFLVPPQGQTNVLSLTLPGDGNFTQAQAAGGGYYGVDFRSVGQIIEGQAFIPQAVTIDATSLSTGAFVTFTIPSIRMNWLIYAGQTRTFQFPALPDLQVTVTPSSGTPSINCAFFNYPALPDEQGGNVSTIQGDVAVSSLPAVDIAQVPTGIGTDYSAATPPTLYTNHIASIPANAERIGYVIQNQSTNLNPVQVVFSTSGVGAGDTIIILNAPTIAGAAGGDVDFNGLPHAGQIDVYAQSATDQVAARAW